MTDRWDRLQDLFDRALPLDATQRASLIEGEAADDPTLRSELQSLLRYSGTADAALDRVVGGAVVDLDRESGLAPGARLGDYTIVRELGRGGSGTVYLASSPTGDVAVKLLWAGQWNDELVHRFHRERRILAKLAHPLITRILDAGTTERGILYEVMEYVAGEPIDTFCDRRMLDVADRVRLFLRVCEAVQYAHEQRIVHRDLKPANILVENEGTPKLLDFGIAKPLDPAELDGTRFSTRTGMRLMTPTYASPEQVRGQAAGPASDVYSLGVILYELLAGRLPYALDGGYPGEVLLAILEEEPSPPSRFEKGVEGDLDQVVLTMLAKEPDQRFPGIARLSHALRSAIPSG